MLKKNKKKSFEKTGLKNILKKCTKFGNYEAFSIFQEKNHPMNFEKQNENFLKKNFFFIINK